MLKNYWTSVELAGISHVPEWGTDQRVSPSGLELVLMSQFELEEDVYWNERTETFEWVFGQQTEYHLVKPRKGKSKSLVGTVAGLLGWDIVSWA